VVFLLGAACLLHAGGQEGSDLEEANLHGRQYPPRVYRTVRLEGEPPRIDGRLDDGAWQEGEWSGDYTQYIPNEGAEPSHPTEIKILYDDENVYVAIRAYDDPEKMQRYPGRRDDLVGDIVGVCFDSYFDKRSGFEFDLTAGGGKIDLILGNEGYDLTWDAVWHGKVGLEDDAWTAEFGIPLSQLRYGPHEEQVWGLHSWRWIARNWEESQWNLIPRNNTGFIYNIGELHGIRGLPKNRRIELLPHALGQVDSAAFTAEDQRERTMADGSAGLDAKVGLSSNFTLDATVNPDFGQVEADPSVINLTAYETFFEEKRPFFLEGKRILDFALAESEGSFAIALGEADTSFGEGGGAGDLLYYSRRIGARPSLIPQLSEGEFTGSPRAATTILTALKISGKTRDGLSVGVVESLASKETVQIARDGQQRQQVVEPYTNYLAARVQKDWAKGNTTLGGMLTSTHRWIRDPALTFLPRDAITGGVDFVHFFADRAWALAAKGVFSQVSGDPEAMVGLQTNPVHYFQRPDATYLEVDPTATSLSGHGGFVSLGRSRTSKWRIGDSVRWVSPGLELNDLGFLLQADVVQNTFTAGYSDPVPRGVIRQWNVFVNREDGWDFGGRQTSGTTGIAAEATFRNKWRLGASLRAVDTEVDTRLLRGGPSMRLSPFLHMALTGLTDPSRRVMVSGGVHGHRYREGGSSVFDLSSGVRLQLGNRFSISTNYTYGHHINDLQYVDTPETATGSRYVLGNIDQTTHSLTVRFNLSLTPDLTVQFYGSPFVSSGRYAAFKRATDTLAPRYEDRFHVYGPDEITFVPEDNAFEVQEAEGGPGSRYSFGNPSFSFREFRSNLVLRWEYRPGSALYVVWSQGRTSDSDLYEDSLGQNWDALWLSAARNVFLVKLQHWFSL
jgi:hypothetical protein